MMTKRIIFGVLLAAMIVIICSCKKVNPLPLNPQQGTVLKNSIGMKLVSIPPGEFEMGDSVNEGDEGERPVHTVDINDPGVSGHEGFNGEMSKYETTNGQYCQFLNVALASGDIYVSDNVVYGANGSNIGADFVDEIYFDTFAAEDRSQIDYNDVSGSFSVRIRDSNDMSNHPVVEVSWYGATAFCNYYGYRLPTEWEWQAVADFDGSYTYGCGTSIDQSKANYHDESGYANPLNLPSLPYTSPVDHYSSYGYGMNDMAGNVWEWTSSISGSDCILRGGCWELSGLYCTATYRAFITPNTTNHVIGFRVCR